MQAPELVQAALTSPATSAAKAGVTDTADANPFPDLIRSSLGDASSGNGKGASPVLGDDGKKLPVAAITGALAAAQVGSDPSTPPRPAHDDLTIDSGLTPDPSLAAMLQRFGTPPHRVTPASANPDPVGSSTTTIAVADHPVTAEPSLAAVLERFATPPQRPPTELPGTLVASSANDASSTRAPPNASGDAVDAAVLASLAARAGGAPPAAAGNPTAQAPAIGVAITDAAAPAIGDDRLELHLESGGLRPAPGVGPHPTSAAPNASAASGLGATAVSYQALAHARSSGATALWDHAIGRQLMGMIQRGQQQARLKLYPAELGAIDIRMNLGADRVDLNFTVQQPVVAQALQHSLPQLAQMFAEHGLSLGQAQVAQQDPGRGHDANPGHAGSASTEGEPGTDAADATVSVQIAARGLLDAFA